jgi:hypothetical protein
MEISRLESPGYEGHSLTPGNGAKEQATAFSLAIVPAIATGTH